MTSPNRPIGLPPVPGAPADVAGRRHTPKPPARRPPDYETPTSARLREPYMGGAPRRAGSTFTNYESNRRKYGEQAAGTAEGLAQQLGPSQGFSPVAQALADAQRRAVAGPSNGAWLGGFIDSAVQGPAGAHARQLSDQARYTADGRRLGTRPGTENIFEKQYTQGMKDTAETVFSALNMDAIESGSTYNVGVETRREAAYGSADSLERQVKNGINPVRAREVMVQNNIAGGLADFQRMSAQDPDMYNAMVYRLWGAGLISGDLADAGLGGWTARAGKALANAMSAVSQLNQQHIPMTLDEYIDSLAKGREQAIAEGGGGAGGAAEPAPRQYTGRDELNARLKSTAQVVLGRSLSDDEASKFAAAFRGTEDAAYNQAEAGSSYENPNASASAQTFVEDGNQTEAAAFRVQGFMERLKTEMGL